MPRQTDREKFWRIKRGDSDLGRILEATRKWQLEDNKADILRKNIRYGAHTNTGILATITPFETEGNALLQYDSTADPPLYGWAGVGHILKVERLRAFLDFNRVSYETDRARHAIRERVGELFNEFGQFMNATSEFRDDPVVESEETKVNKPTLWKIPREWSVRLADVIKASGFFIKSDDSGSDRHYRLHYRLIHPSWDEEGKNLVGKYDRRDECQDGFYVDIRYGHGFGYRDGVETALAADRLRLLLELNGVAYTEVNPRSLAVENFERAKKEMERFNRAKTSPIVLEGEENES